MLLNLQLLPEQRGAQRDGGTRALPATWLVRSNMPMTPDPFLNTEDSRPGAAPTAAGHRLALFR
jgi:hypothetical protein